MKPGKYLIVMTDLDGKRFNYVADSGRHAFKYQEMRRTIRELKRGEYKYCTFHWERL